MIRPRMDCRCNYLGSLFWRQSFTTFGYNRFGCFGNRKSYLLTYQIFAIYYHSIADYNPCHLHDSRIVTRSSRHRTHCRVRSNPGQEVLRFRRADDCTNCDRHHDCKESTFINHPLYFDSIGYCFCSHFIIRIHSHI